MSSSSNRRHSSVPIAPAYDCSTSRSRVRPRRSPSCMETRFPKASPLRLLVEAKSISVGRVVEVHEHPRIGYAFALQRLVAMVAILQQQTAVLILGEQRRGLPALFDALLH